MTPSARVLAFLASFQQTHADAVGRYESNVDFDDWEARIAKVDAEHFLDGAGMELAWSFSPDSPHDPATERLVGEEPEGDRVLVRTEKTDGITWYFEYELAPVGADWRIARLRQSFDPPGAPFVDPADRERFTSPPSGPLREPEAIVEVNGHRLFEAGRVIERDGRTTTLDVREVGRLAVPSGVLVTGDLGYDATLLEPLLVRVPPGPHRVQAAVAFDRIAALRVLFSDAPVVRWHPADGPSGGHVVGVDAGNLAVLDAGAVVAVSARDKERAFEAYVDAERPKARMLSFVTEGDGVVADSGWGDGTYPQYWGIDAEGRPAVLLLDFLVLAEFLSVTVDAPVRDGVPDGSALAAHGVTLAAAKAKRGWFALDVRGRVDSLELLGRDGDPLAPTEREVRTGGASRTESWKVRPKDVHAVRVVIPTGRRN